jgi:hypothetical protein
MGINLINIQQAYSTVDVVWATLAKCGIHAINIQNEE